MFGATAVRQKRERERRVQGTRLTERKVFPYIEPFGPSFDKSKLPYFKHREALEVEKEIQHTIHRHDEVKGWMP